MKLLTYNTQCKPYHDSELNGINLSSLDLIFLQRCNINLANKLQDLFGLKKVWTPAYNGSKEIGLCVLYKDQINVVEHTVDVDIQVDDINQCNVYQKIQYRGFNLINFLPPFLPAYSKIPYLINVWSNNFDCAVGDTHFNIANESVRELLKNEFEVVNRKNNFMDLEVPLTLSWIVINKSKFKLVSEDVHINTNQQMCHFPIFFDLESIE